MLINEVSRSSRMSFQVGLIPKEGGREGGRRCYCDSSYCAIIKLELIVC